MAQIFASIEKHIEAKLTFCLASAFSSHTFASVRLSRYSGLAFTVIVPLVDVTVFIACRLPMSAIMVSNNTRCRLVLVWCQLVALTLWRVTFHNVLLLSSSSGFLQTWHDLLLLSSSYGFLRTRHDFFLLLSCLSCSLS